PARFLRQLDPRRQVSPPGRHRQPARRGSGDRRRERDEQRAQLDEHELRSVRAAVLRRADRVDVTGKIGGENWCKNCVQKQLSPGGVTDGEQSSALEQDTY